MATILLVALSIVGLAVAVFSIQGGESTLSLPHLAELVGLPQLRESVGSFLHALEADGPLAWRAALAGLAAMLLGGILLVAALIPRRERLIELESAESGTIAARRRSLARAAEALAAQVRGVTSAKARVSSRGRGGSIRVAATRSRPTTAEAVETAIHKRVDDLAEPFGLAVRTSAKIGEKGARVQ